MNILLREEKVTLFSCLHILATVESNDDDDDEHAYPSIHPSINLDYYIRNLV